MILRIVAPLVASVGAAATLKQDMCVSPMAPSFSMACFRWGDYIYSSSQCLKYASRTEWFTMV